MDVVKVRYLTVSVFTHGSSPELFCRFTGEALSFYLAPPSSRLLFRFVDFLPSTWPFLAVTGGSGEAGGRWRCGRGRERERKGERLRVSWGRARGGWVMREGAEFLGEDGICLTVVGPR